MYSYTSFEYGSLVGAPATMTGVVGVYAFVIDESEIAYIGSSTRNLANGAVRLTRGDQKEPEAGCAITRPRLHSAIRSPPRLGRSAASIGRRDGVVG